jgi:hypothetical protein
MALCSRVGFANGILSLLFGFLNETYRHPDLWSHVWLAGSGVSYQWSAAREPGDLDVLMGVNYLQFRKAHPEYMGLGDAEISKMLNGDFREHLPARYSKLEWLRSNFLCESSGATDIRAIRPYAAYNLIITSGQSCRTQRYRAIPAFMG